MFPCWTTDRDNLTDLSPFFFLAALPLPPPPPPPPPPPTLSSFPPDSTHKGANQRSKYVTQVQQRPDSSTVTLTCHECKYKVHKLLQRFIFKSGCFPRLLSFFLSQSLSFSFFAFFFFLGGGGGGGGGTHM